MANEFKAKAAARAAAPRKPRNQASGQFEVASPLTDRVLLSYVTEAIRACDTLAPIMLALSRSDDDRGRYMQSALKGLLLLRTSFERQLYPADSGDVETVDVGALVDGMRRNWAAMIDGSTPGQKGVRRKALK